MYLMRFDRNRSLRNLKFYFEMEIFRRYKVSVLVGGLIPPCGQIPLEMVIFQGGYISKELINTSKTNGWIMHLEHFETIFAFCRESQWKKKLNVNRNLRNENARFSLMEIDLIVLRFLQQWVFLSDWKTWANFHFLKCFQQKNNIH